MKHLNTIKQWQQTLSRVIINKPLIVFKSISGNVRNFVKRTGFDSFEINDDNIYSFDSTDSFVLIAPTYDDFMLEDLQDFMEDNHDKCVGIIGSGNYNFADLYIFTAKDFSKKYNIPIIYDFENRGNKKDIKKFKEIIEGMIE